MIKKLDELFTVLKAQKSKRLVAAYANDAHTIGAVSQAVDLGIIEATWWATRRLLPEFVSRKILTLTNLRLYTSRMRCRLPAGR